MYYQARLGQADTAWYDLAGQFTNYWNQLKSFITDLTNLDQTIIQQNSQLQVIKGQATDPAQLASVQQAIDRNVSYYNLWADLKNNITQYLPTWLQTEQAVAAGPPEATQDVEAGSASTTTTTTTGMLGALKTRRQRQLDAGTTRHPRRMSGLGIIPLILISAAALAALAYVAVKGLQLLQQVHAEDSIISDLKAGTLTTQQAQALLPYGVTPAPMAESALSIGTYFIVGIPILIGLLYLWRR